MKRILFAFLIITASLAAKGQDIMMLSERIRDYASIHKFIRVMDMTGGHDKLDASKAGEILKLQIESSVFPDSLMTGVEKVFFKENLNAFDTFYKGIKNIGEQGSEFTVKANKRDNFIYPIIHLSKFTNDTILTIGGLYYDLSLNNLRLNEQDRRKHIVSQLITPFVYNIKDLFKIDGINKISLICGYLSKDFSNKFDHGLSETLSVIFTKETLISFYNAEITEAELFAKSDIFYTNSEMEDNLKKIQIKE